MENTNIWDLNLHQIAGKPAIAKDVRFAWCWPGIALGGHTVRQQLKRSMVQEFHGHAPSCCINGLASRHCCRQRSSAAAAACCASGTCGATRKALGVARYSEEDSEEDLLKLALSSVMELAACPVHSRAAGASAARPAVLNDNTYFIYSIRRSIIKDILKKHASKDVSRQDLCDLCN